jgi:hypothetical protein
LGHLRGALAQRGRFGTGSSVPVGLQRLGNSNALPGVVM